MYKSQIAFLLGIAEPGKGRVVCVTDAGWISNNVLQGEGIGGVSIEDHNNAAIMENLLLWAAGKR